MRYLSYFKKAGFFVAKGSVFALLAISSLQAQQWEEFSSEEKAAVPAQKNEASRTLPKKITFGAPRQNIQTKPVVENMNMSDKGKILLYMKNFKIFKSLAGITSCSMNFFVKSSLQTPVSNISFRLKWPNFETPVSFDDVPSNGEIYKAHAFAGDVCYTLDKTPNIIVNRCRVKGMTQQDCANRIEWVK